jgi:hypothetical protein
VVEPAAGGVPVDLVIASGGADANAGVAASGSDVVAVAFGDRPSAEVLAAAAAVLEEREARAVAIGTGVLDPHNPDALHARELLRGTFEPRALVLRRSMWQAIDGFDESLPPAGLDAWAAAVALVDEGVPLVPLEAGLDGTGTVLPGARERARRHVAARHAELFARHYVDVREQFDLQVEDLERQRDVALSARDEALRRLEEAAALLDEADAAKVEAQHWARGADRRADEADARAAAASAAASAAEERALAAERLAEETARALGELRQTRAVRAANAWWRLKQRVLRRG